MDFVVAENIEVRCHIGCTPEERAFHQRLLVSVKVGTDTRVASRTLNLGDSICYATICQVTRELAQAGEWVLVEQLANKISDQLFLGFPLVSTVDVTVKKFVIPGVEWTGVQIFRERE